MAEVSASTINRVTALQGLKTCDQEWVTSIELELILQAPKGYPTSGLLHNLNKSGVVEKRDSIKTSKKSGRTLKEFRLTSKGEDYLANNAGQIQEFGSYDLILTKDVATGSKQSPLPLANEPKFSSTVMAAMREVEMVGTINENAHTCIEGIKRCIEAYKLKDNADDLDLSGALSLVQEETRALNIIINKFDQETAEIQR